MRRWQLAHGRHLDFGDKAQVMGILNVTPNSFSDGGQFESIDRAVAVFPEAEAIFERNMEVLESLGMEGWAALHVGPRDTQEKPQ